MKRQIFRDDGTVDLKTFRDIASHSLLDPDPSRTAHYRIDNMLQTVIKYNAQYAILLGGRQLGKSTEVAIYLLRKCYEKSSELFYIRRHDTECRVDDVMGWCGRHLDIEEITDGDYNAIRVWQGKIFFAKYDDDGNCEKRKQFGWYQPLSIAGNKKSVQYPKVEDAIFEEMIPEDKPWLADEPVKLESFISTVFRHRNGTCWMIGNTISKLCPYVPYWELNNVGKMKPGQMDIYDKEVSYMDDTGEHVHHVIYAVEECKGVGLFGRMASGQGSKQITSNEYRTFSQPHVDKSFIDNNCEARHIIYMKCQNLYFKMQFMEITEPAEDYEGPTQYFWYVTPAPSNIKKVDLSDKRLITDEVDFNPLHGGFAPISQKEKMLFDFFATNKIFFCNDMCGTDWKQCFTMMRSRR